MSIERQARRDAKEYARAQMFYGEGAGTRRKLITNTVDAKSARNPAYAREFHRELSRQDMSEHAAKARHERQRKDATESIGRNTRGLVSGNYSNVNTGVLIAIVGAYLAHQTGLDEKIYNKGKEVVWRIKRKFRKGTQSHTTYFDNPRS